MRHDMSEHRTLLSDTAESADQQDALWRNEVQAKLARYRDRRGRRIEGAFSMRFPFSPGEDNALTAADPVDVPTPQSPHEIEIKALDFVAESEASDDGASPALAVLEIAEPRLLYADTSTSETTLSCRIQLDVEQSAAGATFVDEKPPAAIEPESEPLADMPTASAEAELEPTPAETGGSPATSKGRPPVRRKIIAFPRAASVTDLPQRLADPVLPEQPRILDVPEELEAFSGTPLAGLQFGPSPHYTPAPHADHIELPVQTASLSRRIYAGVVDCLLVVAASGVFGAAAYKLLPKQHVTKPMLLTAAALPVVLWFVYQYIFLLYAATTPGMRAARVNLSTFKGGRPTLRERRSRLIALYFSTASLTMGLLWGLVDVDALCWHDRISHTYLTDRD